MTFPFVTNAKSNWAPLRMSPLLNPHKRCPNCQTAKPQKVYPKVNYPNDAGPCHKVDLVHLPCLRPAIIVSLASPALVVSGSTQGTSRTPGSCADPPCADVHGCFALGTRAVPAHGPIGVWETDGHSPLCADVHGCFAGVLTHGLNGPRLHECMPPCS